MVNAKSLNIFKKPNPQRKSSSLILAGPSTMRSYQRAVTTRRFMKSLTLFCAVVTMFITLTNASAIITMADKSQSTHQTKTENTDVFCMNGNTVKILNSLNKAGSGLNKDQMFELYTLFLLPFDGTSDLMQNAIIIPSEAGKPNAYHDFMIQPDMICMKKSDIEKFGLGEYIWKILQDMRHKCCDSTDLDSTKTTSVEDAENEQFRQEIRNSQREQAEKTSADIASKSQNGNDALSPEKCGHKGKRDLSSKRSWNALSNGWGKRNDNIMSMDDEMSKLQKHRQRSKYGIEKLFMIMPKRHSNELDTEQRFIKRCAPQVEQNFPTALSSSSGYDVDNSKPMNNIEPAEIVNLFWMPLGDTVGQHNGKSKIDKRGWEKLNGAYGKRVGWHNLTGMWGKRDDSGSGNKHWNKLHGPWGKK